ncbi:ferric reductase family protein [Aspergillus melleus]|uniref:ferric reductase family protein n=1 Tax=Aspergillus melleus TaxID=138277 RepID=UPI001E8D8A3E|nr:uncharacterized protein LDX57_013027 [Aspergillus melleus]KAH8435397.1 hypothetical protein LDX57_013027 [Aspergillus melleus]
MTLALQSFHISVATLNTKADISIQRSNDFAGILGAVSVGALLILSLALVRRWSYETFLRTHQILAAVNVYGIFRHLPHNSQFAKVCVYIALGALALTSSVQLMVFLYRNGLFAARGCPRAIVHSYGGEVEDDSKEIKDGVVKMCITLPRPIRVEPGQYINLWMPTVSLCSWAQTHPFTVVSWSPDPQGTLDLLVKPSGGFSADIFRHLKPFQKQETSVVFMSFFTGPHGISKKVNGYESVVVVASGFGIAAVVPYIRHMIHGYNTCTSQVRRIHLVWQVESPMGIAVVSENLLNRLLDDDIVDKGYILNISIYQRNGQLLEAKLPVGDKSKVFMYQGSPDYQQMISLETSGDLIERHSDIPDKCGDALVMVSTTDDVRDQLREIIRERNDTRVNLMELEYQPSKA